MKPGAKRQVRNMSELTPREAEMLKLFREGKKKKEIAEILGVKYATVDGMLYKAQEKERYK